MPRCSSSIATRRICDAQARSVSARRIRSTTRISSGSSAASDRPCGLAGDGSAVARLEPPYATACATDESNHWVNRIRRAAQGRRPSRQAWCDSILVVSGRRFRRCAPSIHLRGLEPAAATSLHFSRSHRLRLQHSCGVRHAVSKPFAKIPSKFSGGRSVPWKMPSGV